MQVIVNNFWPLGTDNEINGTVLPHKLRLQMSMQCLSLLMSQIKYAVSDAGVRDDTISKFHLTLWKQDVIFCNSGKKKMTWERKNSS